MKKRGARPKETCKPADPKGKMTVSANAHVVEAGMAERAPLPWSLNWDANGELERHDRYDLLMSTAALEKACALAPSPWAEESAGWLPSCRFPERSPGRPPLGFADPGSHR